MSDLRGSDPISACLLWAYRAHALASDLSATPEAKKAVDAALLQTILGLRDAGAIAALGGRDFSSVVDPAVAANQRVLELVLPGQSPFAATQLAQAYDRSQFRFEVVLPVIQAAERSSTLANGRSRDVPFPMSAARPGMGVVASNDKPLPVGLYVHPWISAAGEVSIRFFNASGHDLEPPLGGWRFWLL